jgi:serine/threonine protein phosphatase 1
MREFVMGDIHGAYKALKQCLKRSGFDYHKDRLIQLGDIVDRNPDVYKCVEELLKIKHLVVVRGNHDDWFDDYCQTGNHPTGWMHGGLETIKSYLRLAKVKGHAAINPYELKGLIKPTNVPNKHRDFFSNLQLYYIDEHGRCFVHGGFNRFLPFTGQLPSTYYWDRDLWLAALDWQNTERLQPNLLPFKIKTSFQEIYLGHTPTTQWNISVPMMAANIYNLDTGAGQGGKLTIMDLSTKKFYQSDPITTSLKKVPG